MEFYCLIHVGAKDAETSINLIHVGLNQFAHCIFSVIDVVHVHDIFPLPLEIFSIQVLLALLPLQYGQAELVEQAVSELVALAEEAAQPGDIGQDGDNHVVEALMGNWV